MHKGQYIYYGAGVPGIKVLAEALHAKRPAADLYTGELVQAIYERGATAGIISDVSRVSMDLNRPRSNKNQPAVDEYRRTIQQIFEGYGMLDFYGRLTKPFLQISLHGMQDEWMRDIEIGTGYGHYCNPGVKKWVQHFLNETGLNYGVDDIFPGYTFRSVLREGDIYGQTSFMGFGPNFHTIQIEISQYLRTHHFPWLVDLFCDLIKQFEEDWQEHDPVKKVQKQGI